MPRSGYNHLMALVFVLIVAIFVISLMFVLPILFSLQAVGSLFVYPRQLKAMFGNRILRRNHALEHATIVVMMEREPGRKFNGFSTDEGFFVQGVRSTEEVDGAAREALTRLKAGEKRLAIHRNCGTTIVAANMISAVSFLAVIGAGLYLGLSLGWELYLLILGSVVLSLALRVPLSLLLQRFVTTDQDLTNAEVGWVEPARPGDLRGGIVGMILAASTVRVRVFHTDPDAVEIIRDDGAVVR
jgi:membrane protein implicated in regulation of membrane protease activity